MIAITLVLLIFCATIAVVGLVAGVVMLLIKLGVIVREAQRPPYQDNGDYRIDQGREVRPEKDRV